MTQRKLVGLLPAAGMARRLGIGTPKELVIHRDKPVIDHSVAHLVGVGVQRVVVVTRPGKEAVLAHLRATWPALRFDEVTQDGEIGNLIDALRAAIVALESDDVYLLFPDTYIAPDPFSFRSADNELTLLCHDAGDRWANFGVVDPVSRRVVEKPAMKPTSTLCWGAAIWTERFTRRLATAGTLTDAINDADWCYAQTIDSYEDIGLGADAT